MTEPEVISRVAQIIERVVLERAIEELEQAYRHQDLLERLTALRKRLEELGK